MPAEPVAAVFVDLQNDFCHPDGLHLTELGLTPTRPVAELVEHVNALAAGVRARGGAVVWLRNVWRDAGEIGVLAERRPLLRQTGCRAGTWGAELLDDLAVQVTDTIIDKRRFSGFFGTDLERLLGESGARSVVIAGVRTEHCVESTVRDAFFRDYRVLVPDDAVISYERDLHDGSLRVMGDTFAWVMPTEAVLGLLSDG